MAAGTFHIGPTHQYALRDIRAAHQAMEDNTVSGKLVVLTDGL
jgi:hypothetical protein